MRLKETLCVAVLMSTLFAAPVLAQKPGGTTAPTASAAPTAKATASAAATTAPAPKGTTGAASAAPGASAAPTGTGATGGASAPTKGPATTTTTPTAAAGTPMDGPTYAVRLRDLEQRIDELKEQIRRSHTRLSLLSDTILSGGGAGSRANIKFKNELTNAFRVTRVLAVLDGAVQYNKTDQSGALAEQTEIPLFSGSIPPGDHTLQILVNLQGNGYGVFSYLRGYRFEVRSSHSFSAVEGKTMNLDAMAYEKGGVTTPLEERPAIRYIEKATTGLADSNTPSAAKAAGVK